MFGQRAAQNWSVSAFRVCVPERALFLNMMISVRCARACAPANLSI